MSDFEFQSQLFPTSGSMHDAMAKAWLTAGGANDAETVRKFLIEMSDEELALEAEAAWELADNGDYDRDSLIDSLNALRVEYLAEVL